MILLLHNRYRLLGGEERAVDDLAWLIRNHLNEDAEILARDSAAVGKAKAAFGLLRGGLEPKEVARAVKRTGARVVHVHNVHPLYGWRALAAAREAGARVVWHLHNYRLVCAVGTCFTNGADCTDCNGRNTRPGVRKNCRGGSRVEAVSYAAALSLWQERLIKSTDAFIVPSAFALQRLRDLGAPLGDNAHVIPSVQRSLAPKTAAHKGDFGLAAGRLTPEKGFASAIEGFKLAGKPLVVAGDGPELPRLKELAAGADVKFIGHVDSQQLAHLRARAAIAIVPSLYQEILPLSALEAMAAGLPVIASDSGGLAEVVPAQGLFAPGNSSDIAGKVTALWRNKKAGQEALKIARARLAPEVIAQALERVYRSP